MRVPAKIGRYQVLGLLGQGAMGVVYRGRDKSLERDVALKVMSAAHLEDADSRARFLREAKASARLQHPNIVTIYELGEHEGQPFMALELLEGLDLQRAIEAGIKPDPSLTLPIILQLLVGLGHAHEHGIVHRDVKPSNVFLPRGLPVKIMDFGVARLTGGMTTKGLVVGTPTYMSPEQVQGRSVDGRSDVFSAGLILYELVTGEKAFKGDTLASVLYKVAHEDPNFDLIPTGGEWAKLHEVLTRALSRDPDRRFPEAAAVVKELADAHLELGGSADWAAVAADQALMVQPAPRPIGQGIPYGATLLDDAGQRSTELTPIPGAEPPTRREETHPGRPIGLVAAGAGGAVAIGLTAILLLGRGRAPEPQPPVSLPSTTTPTPAGPPQPPVSVPAHSLPSAPPTSVAPAATPSPQVPPPTTVPGPGPTPLPAEFTPAPTPFGAATDTPTPPPATPEPALSLQQRAERADKLLENGQFRRALAEAQAVLRVEPRHTLAQIVAQEGEASIVVEESVRRARNALDRGDVDEALTHLRRGMAVRQNDARLMALWREATSD